PSSCDRPWPLTEALVLVAVRLRFLAIRSNTPGVRTNRLMKGFTVGAAGVRYPSKVDTGAQHGPVLSPQSLIQTRVTSESARRGGASLRCRSATFVAAGQLMHPRGNTRPVKGHCGQNLPTPFYVERSGRVCRMRGREADTRQLARSFEPV